MFDERVLDQTEAARPARWLRELNPEQRAAVLHEGPPVVVVAGAGSGKTKTLTARVAHLIDGGTAPERILLLTFTRRAAQEMLARAERIAGPGATHRVWGGTFHAVANRLLRIYGRALSLPPNFTVMDASDSADLMDLVRGEQRRGEGQTRFPRKETLAAIYSAMVNRNEKLGRVLDGHFPWCAGEITGIRAIFESYTKRKREQVVLDYDDLLLYWRALTETPQASATLAGLFDHVLVDEYQDTNTLQADILQGMHRPRAGLMVVGDDAQAIYSFRAATVANILDFSARFPGASVLKLEHNYRSTPPILDASNALMKQATRAYSKELWSTRTGDGRTRLVSCLDEAQQSDAVCRRVLEQREEGVPLKSQAVLFRTGHHSSLLEIELARRNIPFVKFGGLKFMEAAHVKDLLAFLRILENPFDEVCWFRVLRLLEGIGPASARRVMEALGVRADGRPAPHGTTPIARLDQGQPPVPAAARRQFDDFCAVITDCALGAGDTPKPAVCIERIGPLYKKIVERLYDSPDSRWADIEQLGVIARGYATTERFVSDLTLDPPASTCDLAGPPLLDDDYLVLSTIHSAKGCEWDAVYIIHAADGMIPSDMALGDENGLDEERRVLYVAMTRARDVLEIYTPLRYYHRRTGLDDAHGYAQVSRFLTQDVKELCESVSLTDETADRVVQMDGERSGVDALLSRLWAG